MRARFPNLFLLLGIVFLFLASVSVSSQEKPSRHECLQSCESEETDPYRRQACKLGCQKLVPHQPPDGDRGRRERGRQEGEKEEKEHEGQQWKGRIRRQDPEERARVRQREEEMKERHRSREKKEQIEEKQDSHSQTHNNPFHFGSNRFRTLFNNKHGHIRLLQRFDQLENLGHYRLVEFNSKPNTLLLPHHSDADFLLVVLSGRALIHLVKPHHTDPYYLHPGYAQTIPAGTTFYLINPDNNKDLRLIKLAIPVNKPAKFQDFFLSSTQDQQSYLQGFSRNILEASFNSDFEEINRVLFGGEERQQQEGLIVELSKEQIRELSKRAKSSSRKTISFEYEPFYLRGSPIYSNNFGNFYELTPEKNSQLRDLDIFLSSVDINQGGLLLPHYNSKAIVILVVNEGEAKIELVGAPREQEEEEEEEEETSEVRKYRAKLSEDDIFVIPAAYPFVVNATSNLNFVAFGINAENNQRNFLAGEKDNVISHIQRQVKEVAFPGSAQDVEKLMKNQRESYFVDAQPQLQMEEGRKGIKGPLFTE